MSRPRSILQFSIDSVIAEDLHRAAASCGLSVPNYARSIIARALGYEANSVIGRGAIPKKLMPVRPRPRPAGEALAELVHGPAPVPEKHVVSSEELMAVLGTFNDVEL